MSIQGLDTAALIIWDFTVGPKNTLEEIGFFSLSVKMCRGEMPILALNFFCLYDKEKYSERRQLLPEGDVLQCLKDKIVPVLLVYLFKKRSFLFLEKKILHFAVWQKYYHFLYIQDI